MGMGVAVVVLFRFELVRGYFWFVMGLQLSLLYFMTPFNV